jgi:hypothetical protein
MCSNVTFLCLGYSKKSRFTISLPIISHRSQSKVRTNIAVASTHKNFTATATTSTTLELYIIKITTMMNPRLQSRNVLQLLIVVIVVGVVHCQTPSIVPSMVPTSALMEGEVSPASMMPQNIQSSIPSDVPVQSEVEEVESSSPASFSPASSSPSPSSFESPSIFPVFTDVGETTKSPIMAPVLERPPTNTVTSDMCDLNPSCAALNLTGLCCPTIDDQFLYCCNGMIEPTCQQNDKCASLGLEGACCPTTGNIPSSFDGIYLDCCDAVPDTCGDTPTKTSNSTAPSSNSTTESAPPACKRMGAVEYKTAMERVNSAAASSSSLMFVVTSTLLAVVGTVYIM